MPVRQLMRIPSRQPMSNRLLSDLIFRHGRNNSTPAVKAALNNSASCLNFFIGQLYTLLSNGRASAVADPQSTIPSVRLRPAPAESMTGDGFTARSRREARCTRPNTPEVGAAYRAMLNSLSRWNSWLVSSTNFGMSCASTVP